jgi:hypothetical protein
MYLSAKLLSIRKCPATFGAETIRVRICQFEHSFVEDTVLLRFSGIVIAPDDVLTLVPSEAIIAVTS